MRHWDGYWFGKRRCWGDTLPHDWNGTGADVFARLPDATGDAAYRMRFLVKYAAWGRERT